MMRKGISSLHHLFDKSLKKIIDDILFFDEDYVVRPIDIHLKYLGQYKGVPTFQANLEKSWVKSLEVDDYLYIENSQAEIFKDDFFPSFDTSPDPLFTRASDFF